MRSGFEKWFKTTEIYESFNRYWNQEQIFRADEDGEYLDSTVNSHFKTWSYRQTEVDELTLQVAEMKSRLNDAYTDGQSAMYTARQSKIDELQKMVDAVKTLIEEYKDPPTEDKAFRYALSIVAYELEQTLKGGE